MQFEIHGDDKQIRHKISSYGVFPKRGKNVLFQGGDTQDEVFVTQRSKRVPAPKSDNTGISTGAIKKAKCPSSEEAHFAHHGGSMVNSFCFIVSLWLTLFNLG